MGRPPRTIDRRETYVPVYPRTCRPATSRQFWRRAPRTGGWPPAGKTRESVGEGIDRRASSPGIEPGLRPPQSRVPPSHFEDEVSWPGVEPGLGFQENPVLSLTPPGHQE